MSSKGLERGDFVRAEGAGVLRGIGATGVDEFNKKSAQKDQINNP